LDPDEDYTVKAEESESGQGYTPFEGMQLRGKVKTTILRGHTVYSNNEVIGNAKGQYIARPTPRP
jgi:allantoinase